MQLLMDAGAVAADKPAWLAVRNLDPADPDWPAVGASDIGPLMNLPGARSSAVWLWAVKTGQIEDVTDDDDPDLPRMEFGTYCENFAAWLLEREQPGWHVTPGGLYRHDDRRWQVATFDRLMHHRDACPDPGTPGCGGGAPPNGTVQIKSSAFADWSETGVPLAIRAQCIWEAAIAGTPRAYLLAFDRNAVKIRLFEIEMDDRALRSLDIMVEAAETFRDMVRRRRRPPVDGSEATTRALQAEFSAVIPGQAAALPPSLAERWRKAIASEKAAKLRRRRLMNELLRRAGTAGTWTVRDAGADGGAVTIATRTVRPRAGHWVKPTERVDTVRPAQAWAAPPRKEAL